MLGRLLKGCGLIFIFIIIFIIVIPHNGVKDNVELSKKENELMKIAPLHLLIPHIANKQYRKPQWDDGHYAIFFDIDWDTSNLRQLVRAVKGVLIISDLSDTVKLGINWTIDNPLDPRRGYHQARQGFIFDPFTDGHVWLQVTPIENIKASYEVHSIIYADGTREDFEP